MITVHNLLTNEMYYGEQLEYYVDEDTFIGEVYLDGDLIYQSVDDPIHDEDELILEFSRTFEIRDDENINDEKYDDDSYSSDFAE